MVLLMAGSTSYSARACNGQQHHVGIHCDKHHVAITGQVTCEWLTDCRLAADTTTVSDQVCLNLNVALRSVTQAGMVLVFMFAASWRLTVVTFIIIPIILVICKLYGQYYRYRHAGQAVASSALLLSCSQQMCRLMTYMRSGFQTTPGTDHSWVHIACECILAHSMDVSNLVHMASCADLTWCIDHSLNRLCCAGCWLSKCRHSWHRPTVWQMRPWQA